MIVPPWPEWSIPIPDAWWEEIHARRAFSPTLFGDPSGVVQFLHLRNGQAVHPEGQCGRLIRIGRLSIL